MADKTIENNLSETVPEKTNSNSSQVSHAKPRPVRMITLIVLFFSVLFLIWYILSDRHAPYTDQARINGLMIPVTSSISGNITQINIRLHSNVKAGDTLFQIDRRPFLLAVEQAEQTWTIRPRVLQPKQQQ